MSGTRVAEAQGLRRYQECDRTTRGDAFASPFRLCKMFYWVGCDVAPVEGMYPSDAYRRVSTAGLPIMPRG